MSPVDPERGHDTRPGETYRWRVGRKVGRTIYAQLGPEPSDDDPLIGMMDTAALAQEAVAGHNGCVPSPSEAALAELLRLKDGPRNAEYNRLKPLAWQRARAVVEQAERQRLSEEFLKMPAVVAPDDAPRCICLPRPYDEDPDCPLHGGS